MTTTDETTSTAGEMASAAKQEGAVVAHSATDAGKQVVSAVSDRTAAVADTAKAQLHTMADQAKQEFRTQAETQGGQVINGLRTLTTQVGALAEGRTQESGQLGSMLGDAQHKLQRYVTSLEDRGPQGLVDDVTRFARQRPGAFLLGAGVAGFAIGRIVRGAAAAERDASGSTGGGAAQQYGSGQWANDMALEESSMRARP